MNIVGTLHGEDLLKNGFSIPIFGSKSKPLTLVFLLSKSN